ncbi:MAG: ATP-grasp domain-containing protein [Betaproteobacteria bacterium]|nr:ATP-grasp domain-containing protein [Betaproteobacteria bacterium]
MRLLLQRDGSGTETRTAWMGAATGPDTLRERRLALEDVASADVQDDDLPVGTVEFLRACATRLGVTLPEIGAYPDLLRPYLRRAHRLGVLGEVRGLTSPAFVRPAFATKIFTGFVFHPSDPEHHEQIKDLAPALPVWFCEPVSWQCEWRYYVVRGGIVGAGRYDPDGADEAPEPDRATIDTWVRAYGSLAPAGYAIDAGVLGTGETALVEINDGWALGYYQGSCSPEDYLRLLWGRWREIVSACDPRSDLR